MQGFNLVKDIDMKVANKMLPLLKIRIDSDIQGEITIDKVRKYSAKFMNSYNVYTCSVSFKGRIYYPRQKKYYDTQFYNETWRGNRVRLNKKFRRFAVSAIVNELKVLGLEGVDRNFEITKINWI